MGLTFLPERRAHGRAPVVHQAASIYKYFLENNISCFNTTDPSGPGWGGDSPLGVRQTVSEAGIERGASGGPCATSRRGGGGVTVYRCTCNVVPWDP